LASAHATRAAAPSANADGWRSDAAQTIVFDRAAGDGR
jgi:hypothetical protein